MYYVYVLLSEADGQFYIGFTLDINRRLSRHRRIEAASTKPRRPLRLLYYEAHQSRADAVRRERYFKTAKGKTTLRQILRDSLSGRNAGSYWDEQCPVTSDP